MTETGKDLSERSERIICLIPMKLPGLNEYVGACRANRYAGAEMKKRIEADISLFVRRLPRFEYPIFIHFHWTEDNRRRDYDNIAFGKKFILDALVKQGRLKDDNRRYVTGFMDTFGYGEKASVTIYIERSKNESD